MKKLFSCLMFVFAIAVLVGCGHSHTFSEDWSSDADNHWHAATCGHADQKQDEAAHTFGEWVVTKAATITEKGSQKRSCTVCGYEQIAQIPQLECNHTYGEWVVTKEATTTEAGSRSRTCTQCGNVETEEIPMITHTHTFSEGWSSDDFNHWHAATCDHTELKEGQAPHQFVNGSCSECGYEKTLGSEAGDHNVDWPWTE